LIYIGIVIAFISLWSLIEQFSFFGLFWLIIGIIFILQTFIGHAQHGKRKRY